MCFCISDNRRRRCSLQKRAGTCCSSAANVTHADCWPDDKPETGASGFRIFISPESTIPDVTTVNGGDVGDDLSTAGEGHGGLPCKLASLRLQRQYNQHRPFPFPRQRCFRFRLFAVVMRLAFLRFRKSLYMAFGAGLGLFLGLLLRVSSAFVPPSCIIWPKWRPGFVYFGLA